MKPIKINIKNKAAIEAALKAVNGAAHTHALTEFNDVADVANAGEARLLRLIPKYAAPGARFDFTSGNPVSSAYAKKSWGARCATRVVLLRRTTGWYLESTSAQGIYKEGGGPGELILTRAQSEIAVQQFKLQFTTDNTDQPTSRNP